MDIKFISNKILNQYKNKTCFLRLDLNAKKGEEKNYYRLHQSLDTLHLLLKNEIKIIIGSHRGRYRKNPHSLKPFQKILANKLGTPLKFFKDIPNPEDIEKSKEKIILLENLRFKEEEETNDKNFAKKLASTADFYINEAFPVCHRKNASVAQITQFLPSFGGLRLQKEIEVLNKMIKSSQSPFTLVLGGKKTSTKVGLINSLWKKIDNLLLGGEPANTFLKKRGVDIGDSIKSDAVKNEIKKYVMAEKTFIPIDYRQKNNKILDIGKETVKIYSGIIKKSKTIIWNGPMGLYEKEKFSKGTKKIWHAMIKNKKADIIIGGGETVQSLKLIKNFNYQNLPGNIFLSTGGGAMLAYLAQKNLPGIEALKKTNE